MNTKIVFAAATMFVLAASSDSEASEYNDYYRRPVDVILVNTVADHTYTLKYCTSGTCGTSSDNTWTVGETFGGGSTCSSYSYAGTCTSSSCATSSNCTDQDSGWEAYGSLWGYQCAQWLAGRTYAVWGVCHQATANMEWYVHNGPGNLPSTVRAWGASVTAFGTYGTDGGAGCY
jgi:hypothetical protein